MATSQSYDDAMNTGTSQTSVSPVTIGLIGSGIFVRDAHVPSILRQEKHLRVTTVFSRNKRNAAALAAQIPYAVAVTNDLTDMLEDEDIEGVVVALPITAMPAVVEQCLQVGKHVLSEKPIAPTVTEAQALIEVAQEHTGRVWMVGENWRFEDAFRLAAQMIGEGKIGVPLLCHWSVHSPAGPSSKYYGSDWRRNPEYPGGYLLDGGVHHIAVLRMLLGDIRRVSAVVAQHSSELPPADTLAATIEFKNGVLGAYTVTYAAAAPWPPILHITGDKGTLRVQRREIQVEQGGQVETVNCDGFDGVEKELVAFAKAIRSGKGDVHTAVEAMKDLAVMEAILEAAESGTWVAPVCA